MSIDTDLKRRLAGLSPEKRAALLAKVRSRPQGEAAARGAAAGIRVHPRDSESHPVSFAQERTWFLYRYEPESAEYNVPQAFRLGGELDPERLRRALSRVVARHELLRAVFRQEGEVPKQVILPPGDPRIEPALPLEDVSGASDPEAEARARATKDAGEPFDLTTGPLLRGRLYRLGPAAHLLYLNIHHIAFDGWSQGILMAELAKLYEADSSDALPPLPIQYLDFGLWQRERLSGDALAEHVEFWRPRLGDVPVLELPTDRPRPPLKTHEGRAHTFELPAELSKRVRDFAATTGVTPFIVLMAAYRALLARHSGQGDFGLGTLIANRLRREAEGLIGFFANTLVMRTDASDDPPFRELVSRERESALEAYARQELPFEKLVEELSPPRDLSRTPLFQAMFILQNAPSGGSGLTIAGLEIEPVGVDSRTAKTDLTLYMTDHPERLSGFFEYNVDLFDAPTIARMADRFRRLLAGAVAEPGLPISELPLLTEDERRTVVEEWNRTERELPPDATIDSLFRERAAADPGAPAVTFGDETLTYGELAERASALAAHLRSRGVGQDALVGVHLERSLDMVVAVLGVMESGAAYVPLDPEYPSDRIAYMLEASGLRVVITQDRLVEKLELPAAGSGESGPEVIRIDTGWSVIESTPKPATQPVRSPDALAYVIFTSGSTGKPKGVQVAHRSVVNFLRSMAHEPGLAAGDSLLAVTTLSFDIAGLELYLPLSVGGRVIVASRDTAQAGEQLLARVREVEPTVMQATPATWRLLLEAGLSKESMPRRILCGGEALPRELADRLSKALGDTGELWNMYGPTETTIWSAVLRVAEGKEQVPVGPPIDNTALYVLDRRLSPAPVGVPGELLIGGLGLARGYLGRPALTAERFLPDAFSNRSGARMYRTGDRVHWRPDGTVAFLGRIDHQVKVRGFRIELGEIESVLASHPKVKQAVVIVREDRPGDKRLAAYTTAAPPADGANEKPATVGELRAHLKERLPDYMVPPIFIALDALPLTPNGKVDRKALPAPDRNRPELGEEYLAPRNPTEAALARIWSETLGLERIGVNDDFFELGGDSLMVIKVVSKANKEELGVTTKQLFQNRTIAELAAVAGTQVLLAEQGSVSGDTPMTPAQLHFLELGHPNPAWHSLGALLEIDVLHEDAVEKALRMLLEQHDNLRVRVVGSLDPAAPLSERRLVTDPEPKLELHRFDLTGLSEEERQVRVRDTVFALTKGFDLANGPLFHAAIYDQGPGQPKMVFLNAHFFAADVGSWHPILDDFDTYYRHLAANGAKGEEPPRMPKTTAAKQWSERLAERSESAELKEEIPFWTAEERRLATPLPYDHPDGHNRFSTATQFMTQFDEEETKALLVTLPRKHGVQIDGLLMTAILDAFHRWTGGRTFLVDLLGHGREALYDDTDLTRTVGWLNTIFPVALTLDDPDDVVASMKSLNKQIRSIPNGGLGYGILRYISRDPRMIEAMASLPQPQVFFNYFGPDNEEQLATFRKNAHWGGYVLDKETRRLRPLAVGVFVKHNRMLIKWEYSPTLHDADTVKAVVEHAEDALYTLLADIGLADRRRKEEAAAGAA
jgi:amino acid adenylation domain-containing protein/non-ribosomal peptide synthase protein (TIGR01720 family)